MPARDILLDGEAIVLRPDGRPQAFQITMRRFGRKLDVDAPQASLPITTFFFVALSLDVAPRVDEPLTRRIAVLNDVVQTSNLVPRIVTASADEAAAFAAQAI